MKKFLTVCICAMVSAGIFGFVDMAGDVKNGTMIQYDHGDEEGIAAYAALQDFSVNTIAAGLMKKKASLVNEVNSSVAQQESTAKVGSKKKKEKEILTTVVTEPVLTETVVAENYTAPVQIDSVPQEIILEERNFEYSDFSRGAPRKYKKAKKGKD